MKLARHDTTTYVLGQSHWPVLDRPSMAGFAVIAEAQTRELRRSINAQMSQVWTILENTRAKRMKGMGRVPEATAEEIDKQVNEMLVLVRRIMQTVKPKTPW